ncbi:hypothetical protein [Kribbella sp. NPDC048915]|uniref:hypothetical protein n=1 Tax=Kribbella sp. NPDC048915 TaxID=3155148 RepID=UPI0033DCDD62
MTDLRELLHTTAAEGSDAVDLAPDVVVDRIRHRRTRNRRRTLVAAALATAVVVGGGAWTILPSAEKPPVADGVGLHLVRSDADGPSGMEAAFQTRLTVDARGCVQASGQVTLVWPRTYTVRGDAKSFEILDGANNVVARSGVLLNIGGGGGGLRDNWTGLQCATGGSVWLVGEISPAR